jgi:hypothetical protein
VVAFSAVNGTMRVVKCTWSTDCFRSLYGVCAFWLRSGCGVYVAVAVCAFYMRCPCGVAAIDTHQVRFFTGEGIKGRVDGVLLTCSSDFRGATSNFS